MMRSTSIYCEGTSWPSVLGSVGTRNFPRKRVTRGPIWCCQSTGKTVVSLRWFKYWRGWRDRNVFKKFPDDAVPQQKLRLPALLANHRHTYDLISHNKYLFQIHDSQGNTWQFIYFVSMVVLGAFFVMNLILGVLSG